MTGNKFVNLQDAAKLGAAHNPCKSSRHLFRKAQKRAVMGLILTQSKPPRLAESETLYRASQKAMRRAIREQSLFAEHTKG